MWWFSDSHIWSSKELTLRLPVVIFQELRTKSLQEFLFEAHPIWPSTCDEIDGEFFQWVVTNGVGILISHLTWITRDTLPKTNSPNAPKNGCFSNRHLLFQGFIFRSELLVSGKVISATKFSLSKLCDLWETQVPNPSSKSSKWLSLEWLANLMIKDSLWCHHQTVK